MEEGKKYATIAWEFTKKYWLPILVGFVVGALLV